MKNMKLITPIILAFLLYIVCIPIILNLLPIDLTIITKYEYWSIISSIVSGFITPTISIFGFIYLYYTFKESAVEGKIKNIYFIIQKYENTLDSILNTVMYNKKTSKDKPWETTIGHNLTLTIPKDIHVEFFYDKECKSEQDLLHTILEIKKLLYFISIKINKVLKIDSKNDIEKYYRLKYSGLVNALNDKHHYFIEKFETYKNASNIKKELDEIEVIYNKFYSKNQFAIS